MESVAELNPLSTYKKNPVNASLNLDLFSFESTLWKKIDIFAFIFEEFISSNSILTITLLGCDNKSYLFSGLLF